MKGNSRKTLSIPKLKQSPSFNDQTYSVRANKITSLWHFDAQAHADSGAAFVDLRHYGRKPQLIISDYPLGIGIDGFELVVAVRDPMAKPIPAIAFIGPTKKPALRDLDGAITPGFFKPFKPLVLRQTLGRFQDFAWLQTKWPMIESTRTQHWLRLSS